MIPTVGTSIGFTGTQSGMTDFQKNQLEDFLRKFGKTHKWFHHGDCIGADAEAHEIAVKLGWWIAIHPPDNPVKRAFKRGDYFYNEAPYLQRNREIVDFVEVLLATPKTSEEEVRSGTWYTVRYARKVPRAFFVIFPKPGVEKERY